MIRFMRARVALALVAVGACAVAATAAARNDSKAAKPIVIGAVVDLTKNMAPFDAPALLAAQIEIKAINAKGGVDGRPLKLVSLNDQLDPTKTKQFAVQMLQKKVDIGWVTCDVNYAAPAAQEFLNAGKLTIAPCLGTDELSPIRFGAKGKLAFSYGNAAQDEGAGVAEYAISRGWKNATVVTDNLLRYFQDVCKAFTVRFTQLGGKVLAQESFKQGDKTIGNIVSRVNSQNPKPQVIAFCTSFAADQPAFVSGLRSLGNETPIIDGWASDGNYWWTSSPKVTNFYFLTYASALARDPQAPVRAFEAKLKAANHPAQTGGFITGADAIDAIAFAIKKAHGSTNGATLANILAHLHKFQTLGGPISFSPGLHSVTGRPYRVVLVNDNTAKVVGLHTTKVVANIH